MSDKEIKAKDGYVTVERKSLYKKHEGVEKKLWVDVGDAQKSGAYCRCPGCMEEILSAHDRCPFCGWTKKKN